MTRSVAEFSERSRSRRERSGLLDRWARRLVIARLEGLGEGRLTVLEDGEKRVFGKGGGLGLEAELRVEDPRFWGAVAFGGSIGAAEAYMDGHWMTEDLLTVLRLMLRNRQQLESLDHGLGRLASPLRRAAHALRTNTKRGSRRNIVAHYDLGNEFFSLFLDPTMMYSSAIFEHPEATLEEASVAKLDRICRKLDLGPEDRVLEIGTGWGGFAVHAASRYGCRITTTTISPSQRRYAMERVKEAGLEDLVEVIALDYRDLEGKFDKLVSVEMIEAVGLDHLETFFKVCGERLKPSGQMLLQAITIHESQFALASRRVDFIQRYIFPGSAIPSISSLTGAVANSTDLAVTHLEDIGPHYARTLKLWRRAFFEHLPEARRMGFSTRFIRLWEYYFAYCEAGFEERAIGDVQILLNKPEARPAALLGSLRETPEATSEDGLCAVS